LADQYGSAARQGFLAEACDDRMPFGVRRRGANMVCRSNMLFRLRYGGSTHSFGFAIYSAATDRYEDAVLLTGSPTSYP
jgi:hypothetical protein